MDWLNANKLSLNVKKSHYMVFHPKREKIDHQLILQINNQTIEQVQATKFLGYIIDEEITWKKHIQYLSNKLSKSIGILKKARKTLYTSTLIQLYYTFLYPYLTAGITLWGKCNKTTFKTLEITHKKAIRLILNKKNRTPSVPLFIKTKILPLKYIYLLSVLSFMFKVHHNKFPSVIQSNFTKRHTISLQNTRQIDYYEVPIAKCTITERSIFFQGPKEFNLIMKKGTNLNISLHAFKRQIKNICLQEIENQLS